MQPERPELSQTSPWCGVQCPDLRVSSEAPAAFFRKNSRLMINAHTAPCLPDKSVLVVNSTLYNRRTEQLAALAARHALPAIFAFREYALAGGLMSYGSSLGYLWPSKLPSILGAF